MKKRDNEAGTASGTPGEDRGLGSQRSARPTAAPVIPPDPGLPQPATWEPRYNTGNPPAYSPRGDEG